ncbi:MAG: cysteine desulfurase [Agathobacter sp.]|nr:cysteine desulfurase [Agathobacter sp.]MBQ2282851.1 cysteine desulfurase [Agathobacter sp.]
MKKIIYMDHAATTQLCPEAKAAMEPYLDREYGNASSPYSLGTEAREAIEKARNTIAGIIDAYPEEIYFTSGGSESDNWAIKGFAGEKKYIGGHIITSKIEHHAVLNSCAYMEGLGYDVTYLDVDDQGIVDLKQLKDSIGKYTTLITVMTGNNEIGTIEPITEIGNIAREKEILFHTDAVQAIGQIPMQVHKMPVDALSASSHKFHGPKGTGFLYVRKGIEVPSFIHGGSQEKGKRAGTENVAGIVGMAEALRVAHSHMSQNYRRVLRMRDTFIKRVMAEIPEVRLNGHKRSRLPGNVNMSIAGVEATALLVLLEEDGILASAGSACTTGQTRISHVIEAIGVPEDYATGTIRFTLGSENTMEEVNRAVEVLKQDVKLLRQI